MHTRWHVNYVDEKWGGFVHIVIFELEIVSWSTRFNGLISGNGHYLHYLLFRFQIWAFLTDAKIWLGRKADIQIKGRRARFELC